ncbi:MAG: rdgB, partial [Glaciihabitans sp.]|nr:rdgB [Glaciihabitans sp.]
VLTEAAGADGFGYDPIFQPEGLTVSAAELSPDEKNEISHRTIAFTRLLPVVRSILL